MIKKITISAIVSILFNLNLFASNNDCKNIDLKLAPNSMTYIQLIEEISSSCEYSVSIKDDFTFKQLDKKIGYMNFDKVSLEDAMKILVANNDLFYKIDKDLKFINVFKYDMKTFSIDYVSFDSRVSNSSLSINNDSGSGSGGGGGSSSSSSSSDGVAITNQDNRNISYSSSFDLWKNLNNELLFVLKSTEDYNEAVNLININKDAGLVSIKGTQKQLSKIENYINKLTDRLHKQILLETKIIQVNLTDNQKTGVDWTKFQLSLSGGMGSNNSGTYSGTTFNRDSVNDSVLTGLTPGNNFYLNYNFSIDGLVSFLKTQGDVSFVSSPSVLTLSNQPAIINIGSTINYRFDNGSTTNSNSSTIIQSNSFTQDSRFVGVTLDITPQISNDNEVILKINPVISSIEKEHYDASGERILAPDMAVKQLSTIIKATNNEKILIGGLITNNLTNTNTSVPGLSAIPLLGEAFKSTAMTNQQTEIIILIIPHIIDEKDKNKNNINGFSNEQIKNEFKPNSKDVKPIKTKEEVKKENKSHEQVVSELLGQ